MNRACLKKKSHLSTGGAARLTLDRVHRKILSGCETSCILPSKNKFERANNWKWIICLVCLTFTTVVKGQNEKFKALFIYNFTNYIEWPSADPANFVIAVLGDSPIIEELKAISKIKKVGTATLMVKKITSIADIGDANIIYVPSQKKKQMADIASALKGKSILIIGDNASDQFGINFIEVNAKQSFQISKSNIESHKLKVNSSLIALGVPVN
jgi:hypothetical protein